MVPIISVITVRNEVAKVMFYRCVSVHGGGGGGVLVPGGLLPGGYLVPGGVPGPRGEPGPGWCLIPGVSAPGGMSAPGGVSTPGGFVSQHALRQTLPPPPRRDGYCCGRLEFMFIVQRKFSEAHFSKKFECLLFRAHHLPR